MYFSVESCLTYARDKRSLDSLGILYQPARNLREIEYHLSQLILFMANNKILFWVNYKNFGTAMKLDATFWTTAVIVVNLPMIELALN